MLDTNVCIAATRGKTDPALRDRLYARFDEVLGQLSMSMLTLFELQFGVEKANQSYRAKNLAAITQLTGKVDVLPFDEKAAMAAAKVRRGLLERGQGIGPYDVLIAGHALSRSLVVVTNNVGEFARVDGLRAEDWTVPHEL